MNSQWHAAPLGTIAEVRKGLSYKGEYLDRPGLPLLGLGVFSKEGGYLRGSGRCYGGPFKSHHCLDPGQLFVALTDITQDGFVLGSPALVPLELGKSIITHHVAAVRPLPKAKVLVNYLYYALSAKNSIAQFRSVATGTTVRAVSVADAHKIEIPLPPISDQRRIADALGALDAWRDSLDRANVILERTLQCFFHELCLGARQRQPSVRRPRKLVGDAPPSTWQRGTLHDLIDFEPRTAIRKGQVVPWVDMKSIPTSGLSVVSWSSRPYTGGSRFQQGDTLLARITPCLENGKTALVDFLREGEYGAGSTEFIIMRARTGVPKAFAYGWARSDVFRRHAIANMCGSSGRQRVSVSALKDFPIAIPDVRSLDDFGIVSDCLLEVMAGNKRMRDLLIKVRDAVSDGLFSGALDASGRDSQAIK